MRKEETMAESVLSCRRAFPTPRGDKAKVEGSGDVSKTGKHASLAAWLPKNVTGRAVSSRPCLLLASLLQLVFLAVVFFSRSRTLFGAFSSFESVSRVTPSGDSIDSLASEFGSLGVPWY